MRLVHDLENNDWTFFSNFINADLSMCIIIFTKGYQYDTNYPEEKNSSHALHIHMTQ